MQTISDRKTRILVRFNTKIAKVLRAENAYLLRSVKDDFHLMVPGSYYVQLMFALNRRVGTSMSQSEHHIVLFRRFRPGEFVVRQHRIETEDYQINFKGITGLDVLSNVTFV
jgi:hypothetical protein